MKAKCCEWEKTYTQEADCCSHHGLQELKIEQIDEGGGPFWRLKSEEWAFDSIDELVETLKEAGCAQSAPKEN